MCFFFNSVIIGAYDAGAVKESVYLEYQNYLKILYKSEPYYDFVVSQAVV